MMTVSPISFSGSHRIDHFFAAVGNSDALNAFLEEIKDSPHPFLENEDFYGLPPLFEAIIDSPNAKELIKNLPEWAFALASENGDTLLNVVIYLNRLDLISAFPVTVLFPPPSPSLQYTPFEIVLLRKDQAQIDAFLQVLPQEHRVRKKHFADQVNHLVCKLLAKMASDAEMLALIEFIPVTYFYCFEALIAHGRFSILETICRKSPAHLAAMNPNNECLLQAIERNDERMAELFIELLPAEHLVRTQENISPFQRALQNGMLRIARLLLSKIDHVASITQLHHIREDLVHAFVEMIFAIPWIYDQIAYSSMISIALLEAINNVKPQFAIAVIRKLYEQGRMDVLMEEGPDRDNSAFLTAAENGLWGVVEVLLEVLPKEGIQVKDPAGNTILHRLAQFDRSSPISEEDSPELQALQAEAIRNNQLHLSKLIRSILETTEGIDLLQMRNHSGQTPFDVAAENNQLFLCRLFREYEGPVQ